MRKNYFGQDMVIYNPIVYNDLIVKVQEEIQNF